MSARVITHPGVFAAVEGFKQDFAVVSPGERGTPPTEDAEPQTRERLVETIQAALADMGLVRGKLIWTSPGFSGISPTKAASCAVEYTPVEPEAASPEAIVGQIALSYSNRPNQWGSWHVIHQTSDGLRVVRNESAHLTTEDSKLTTLDNHPHAPEAELVALIGLIEQFRPAPRNQLS